MSKSSSYQSDDDDDDEEMTTNMIENRLDKFAKKHGLVFEPSGEVGLGRPCVGFLKNSHYVEYEPVNMTTYQLIWPEDSREFIPDEVVDAYHKHCCVAVSVRDGNYREAMRQLDIWATYLDSAGATVHQYPTGASGVQAIFSGAVGYAFRLPSSLG